MSTNLRFMMAIASMAAIAACATPEAGNPRPLPDAARVDTDHGDASNDTTADGVGDLVEGDAVDEVREPVDGETIDEVREPVDGETIDDVREPVDGETVEEVHEPVDGETVEEVHEPVDGETIDDVSDPVDGETIDGPDGDIPSPCQSDAECDTGVCDDGVCVGCDDGITNGEETDVDCGGPDCGACAVGGGCLDDDDCGGRRCLNGTCRSRPASRIAVGSAHACAIVTGGRIVCWGDNSHGQCGVEGGATSVAPSLVGDSDFDGFEMVAVGSRHTCAARGAELYCWGDNSLGQVGQETPLASGMAPTQVTRWPFNTIHWFDLVALGDAHTCVTYVQDEDFRSVTSCWGDNRLSQNGVGSRLTRASTLSAGRNHTCAIAVYASPADNSLSSVMCWGDNVHRQADPDPYLGADVISSASEVSVRTSSLRGLATGDDTSCFLLNGSVQCWGDLIAFGANPPTAPVSVGPWTDVAAISVNGGALCVIRDTDSVECIGASGGDMALSPTEARAIVGLDGPMADVQVGGDFGCALGQDGSVRCWGDNTHGQLGRAAPSSSSSALPIDL